MEKLPDLMMWVFLVAKYSNLGSPFVNLHINNIVIQNTLTHFSSTTNIITWETMEALGPFGYKKLPTMPQLFYRSTIKPKIILKDVVITINLWEYPIDFMVL